MIVLEGVSRDYGSARGVDGLGLTIQGPGVVGLLGPNGSGKTTTLRLMAGVFPPSRGRVLLDGSPVVENPGTARRIGYLPEIPPLYPEMRVEAYLDFVARLKGLTGAEARPAVQRVMALTLITDRAADFLGNLSKGYKQRVGLAQALVHGPDHVILDEPTSGLDPLQIDVARAVIRDVARTATVVLSTHMLAEVHALCSRVLVLKEGRLVGDLEVAKAPTTADQDPLLEAYRRLQEPDSSR